MSMPQQPGQQQPSQFQQQPATPQAPAMPPNQKRFGFVALGIAGVVGLVLGAAVFAGGSAASTATPAPVPTVTVTTTVQAEAPGAGTEAPSERAADWSHLASVSPSDGWRIRVAIPRMQL